jgi:hypothetical protein
LVPCAECGRKFNADRLPKHQKACKKSNHKRKTFNSAAARVEGTGAEKFVGKGFFIYFIFLNIFFFPFFLLLTCNTAKAEPKQKEGALPKPKKWKQEHDQFIAALRAARGASNPAGGDGFAAPAAPTIDPSLVQCPHCERRFNATSAERRISLSLYLFPTSSSPLPLTPSSIPHSFPWK